MKKILVVCMLLSLGLTCFLVGCNKGERKGLEPKYNATITVSENNNGDGVANANIFCDGNKVGETDSNGKYVLDDLSGEHEIKVSASGYLFENDKMKVSQNSKEVTFKAIKSFKLSGTVQSGDILIQGAKVKIEGDHPSEILTDINGKFAIDTTGNATKITAEYQGVIFEEDNSGYNKTTENNNIVFNGYYRKTVVVRSGNLRINNAKVQVTDNTGELYINTSGSNGEYTFNKLYGSLSINAVHNEYDDDGPTISNSIGDSVQINKKFTLKGSITGVDLEGVVVSAAGITTTTNESGEFTLSGLSGNVALNVAKTNYTYVYSADNALLNSKTYNFAVVNINIKVQSFLISGTVTSGSIKVYDAEVSSDKQFGASPIKTDALGNFSIWVTEPCVIAFLKDEYSINSYHVDKAKTGVEISATYSVSGQIGSDRIGLEGVLVEITDELGYYQSFTTLTDGLFSFSGLTGEAEISASSNNKEFNNMPRKVRAQSSPINISNTSYIIEGYVKTGEVAVVNVEVKAQTGETCLTNNDGYYKFEALEGENILAVIKEGYTFNDITVNFEDEGSLINFSGTFKISGVVKSGNLFIAGATVEILGTDLTTTTDSSGYYEFTGLDFVINLKTTKTGYTFTGTTNFKGADLNANFESTFKVKVKVVIDSPISGVLIYHGADILGETDSNGECEIALNGTSTITFFKDGYEFSSATLKEPEILNVNAAFVVTINVDLNGTLITSGFTITNDGQAAVLQGDNYLVKSNTRVKIELKSDNYELIGFGVQNPFYVSDALVVTFYAYEYYNISGRLQTYTGANTENLSNYSSNLILKSEYKIGSVTQPTYQRTIAANGNYTISSFGITTIVAENYLIDSTKLYLIEEAKTISSATNDVNFTLVAAKEFALHLFKEAERLSNEADGRYVTVNGSVQNSVATQNIFGFKARDEYGNIKNLAGNYGGNILYVVNPRVACLTYVPTSATGGNPNDAFRTFKTKDNIVNNLTGDDKYGLSKLPAFENVNRQDYVNNRMGFDPESITSYIVNYNTVNSATVKFENSEWIVGFDFNVSGVNSAVINYQKQITYFLPMGSFGSWTSAQLTMTLNNSGYIKTLDYYEKYKAAGYDVIASPKETYHITDGTTKISANLQRNGINITNETGTIISH